MQEEENLIRVSVHPNLIAEFKARKEMFEKKVGYKIEGGYPIISKICAEELKRNREKNKKQVRLEVNKVKGIKKSRVTFLFDL